MSSTIQPILKKKDIINARDKLLNKLESTLKIGCSYGTLNCNNVFLIFSEIEKSQLLISNDLSKLHICIPISKSHHT